MFTATNRSQKAIFDPWSFISSMLKNLQDKSCIILISLFLICLLFLSGPVFQLFSYFHSFHHSDTLILSIISYQKLTPYLWGQDRFLMVLPAICSLIGNPYYNLFFLTWLQVILLFSGLFLLSYLIEREFKFFVFCTLLFILLLTHSSLFWHELIYQPYSSSIFFACLSLILLDLIIKENQYSYLLKFFIVIVSSFLLVISFGIAQPVIVIIPFIFVSLINYHYGLIKFFKNLMNRNKNLTYVIYMWCLFNVLFYILYKVMRLFNNQAHTQFDIITNLQGILLNFYKLMKNYYFMSLLQN